MSENVEAMRRAYDALVSGDLDGFLAFIDPEVEFNSLVAEAEGRTFRGHEGVREWWSEVREFMGGIKSEIEEIREPTSDTVLAKVIVRGRVRGVPVEQVMWQAALFGEGPAAVWWHFARTDEEALGALDRRLEARG